MKVHTTIIFKDEPDVKWVITNNDDLHNCELKPVDVEGAGLICLDSECPDNELNDIDIVKQTT